ncbi:hypothetical protein NADFUDRAFT_50299 [Nadsonia fulvescens var. elongata DSM 6958]|uniref:Conserved oligomeric Golgi complex subunit 2 n=1 Tax=Nadsonia fulvescens var. elongata DSM 6958 TaxID=857566 RepID=A0A1E3PN64_9ASCO|nr:hypothetical protein NADFUDRAFT_50299 [Nadsonia fulvescens var. elongata DSM 6958]
MTDDYNYDETYVYDSDGPLPVAREITRAAFCGDSFDINNLLTEYHRYQTLEDLRSQLQHWGKTIQQELVNVINEDYGDFIELGQQLDGGVEKVASVETSLRSFRSDVNDIKTKLDDDTQLIDGLLSSQRKLSYLESQIRALITYEQKISDLELELVSEFDSENLRQVLIMNPILAMRSIVVSYLAVKKFPTVFPQPDHPMITSQVSRLGNLRTSINSRMKSLMAEAEPCDKYELILLYRHLGEIKEGIKSLK